MKKGTWLKLKTELAQVVFWAIAFGVVLGVIILIGSCEPTPPMPTIGFIEFIDMEFADGI